MAQVSDESNYRHCDCGAETVPLVVDGVLRARECPRCGRGCTCVFSREALEEINDTKAHVRVCGLPLNKVSTIYAL